MSWIATLRPYLEMLYFISGIAIAIVAVIGLRQLRIGLKQVTVGLEQVKVTKAVAEANRKRESVRYAADQCLYFAEKVNPLVGTFASEYKRQKLTFVPPPSAPPHFQVRDGEITVQNYDLKVLADQWPMVSASAIAALNAVEGFSIPFAEGVAEEEIGYRETALGFCQTVQTFLPVIYHLRIGNAARYESTVRLYATWSRRLVTQLAAPIIGTIEQLKKDAEKDRIRPIRPEYED